MDIRKCPLKKNEQGGTVLFMALMFLVLTALIAVTMMDTVILARKMATNSQFQEEAMQVTEGLVSETANAIIQLLDSEEFMGMDEVLCMADDAGSGCALDPETLPLSNEIRKSSAGSMVYKASFGKQKNFSRSGARMSESEISEGLLMRYIEIEGSYEGVNGVSQASLTIGVMNKALLANGRGKKVVKAEANGVGGGTYNTFY